MIKCNVRALLFVRCESKVKKQIDKNLHRSTPHGAYSMVGAYLRIHGHGVNSDDLMPIPAMTGTVAVNFEFILLDY